jgi:putative membrane-bound dehydrogenase-like protein
MNNVSNLTRYVCTLVMAGSGLAGAAAEQPKAAAPSSANISTNMPKPAHNRGFGRDVALKEMEKMALAQGLEVSLFASEPDLVNPCNMDVDARGRVWITEGANYRKWASPPRREGGDRIVILEDKNGDAVADKTSVFYQGPEINSALGICVLGNKVIVSCSPNIFVLTDTDGDSKADKKELLFTGIGGVQHDHGVHAFVFGPDGKLYFNMGNEGQKVRDKDGNPIIDLEGNEVAGKGKPYRQGMVFRCNLDGSEFETLAHNFRNNFEVCVDSFGTLWQSDNDDDGHKGVRINYVMERGNFGYQDELKGESWGSGWKRAQEKGVPETEKTAYEWHLFDPGVVPNLLHTGAGSPCGIVAYEGKLLPRAFQNQVIHCDAGSRVVRSYPVEADGAGYTASITNLLSSGDSWFRPSDVCVAPDGSLLVADWNDPGVGGHAAGDHDLSMMRGRVYRIAPKGAKYTAPKLELKSATGAVAALQSPNHETRYLAWTALAKMEKKAQKPLEKLAAAGNEPRMRARALQLLARIPGNNAKTVSAAINDSDADIRIVGLRMARALELDVIPLVRQLAKDPSAQVRRECAIALRHNKSPEAPALWAALARQHDGNRWYLEALGIGANRQEDAFFDAWLASVNGNWNTPIGRDIVWRSRAIKSAPLLVKLITEGDAKEKDRYMRALDYLSGPAREKALEEIAIGSL